MQGDHNIDHPTEAVQEYPGGVRVADDSKGHERRPDASSSPSHRGGKLLPLERRQALGRLHEVCSEGWWMARDESPLGAG